jgi:hypothetical protein
MSVRFHSCVTRMTSHLLVARSTNCASTSCICHRYVAASARRIPTMGSTIKRILKLSTLPAQVSKSSSPALGLCSPAPTRIATDEYKRAPRYATTRHAIARSSSAYCGETKLQARSRLVTRQTSIVAKAKWQTTVERGEALDTRAIVSRGAKHKLSAAVPLLVYYHLACEIRRKRGRRWKARVLLPSVASL